ncbi:MAG TPA: cupin domain-containing protein [Steroidobacteraceae bacterium]|nr:cupin domain-containing protein [Steroidobacteraceae bacterium]
MKRPWTTVPKIWGREIILHDGDYCAKFLQYDGPYTSSEHYHQYKHETFVVTRGEFSIMWYDFNDRTDLIHTQNFKPGELLVLPPFTVHRITCTHPEGGVIFEASSVEDPNDCVRLAPSINPHGQG